MLLFPVPGSHFLFPFFERQKEGRKYSHSTSLPPIKLCLSMNLDPYTWWQVHSTRWATTWTPNGISPAVTMSREDAGTCFFVEIFFLVFKNCVLPRVSDLCQTGHMRSTVFPSEHLLHLIPPEPSQELMTESKSVVSGNNLTLHPLKNPHVVLFGYIITPLLYAQT